jgi:hypothetical protein
MCSLMEELNCAFGTSWDGLCSNELPKPYGVGLWKNIRRDLKMFSSHIRFEMGDGYRFRF